MLTAEDTMVEEDNLSISMDSFFKILNEEPAPPPPTIQGSCEGLHQDTLAPIDYGKTSKVRFGTAGSTPVMNYIGELGYSQWNSSSCMEAFGCEGESGVRLLSVSEGTFNDFNCMYPSFAVDSGSFNSTEHGNSIQFCSPPANGSSDFLRASSSEDSGAEGLGLSYSPYVDLANDLYLNNGHEKGCLPMGGETSSPMKVMEPATDVNKNPFFMLQNGEKDLSQIMLTKNSGFSKGMHSDKYAGSTPVSAVRECKPLSMSSHLDPGEMPSGILHADTDINETLPSQYIHPLISSEKEATVQWKESHENQNLLLRNSCMPSEVKFVPHEEYLDTSMTELSVIDLDIQLPYIPSVEQSHCKDILLTGESSTDSSPVPSTRSSVSASIGRPVINTSRQRVPDPNIASPNKRQKCLPKDKGKVEVPVPRYKQRAIPRRGCEAIQKISSRISISVDDDADICVLDDISDPVRPNPPSAHRNHYAMLQQSGYSDPHYNIPGGIKLSEDDERLTFQIALQNLSQPISEASPPNGLLAVPLLRHQRIALSWMVQKETKNPHCCGGILADDQGLGKTISTIALILMERSPPSISCSVIEKPNKLEALDLDDDNEDSDVSVVNAIKQTENSCLLRKPIKHESSVMVVKGRPAAGTLVVCPTSVLRQWAEELQNKVTREANLSFLVYHGGNRTRDPDELAKYDVVLTTYAIVSIEVPKQPLVDKDDDEDKKKLSGHPTGCLTTKKRKNSQNSTTKTDSGLLEATARPLARVGWFRVILDEAQSIKNHRTQVARSCWGLRAKRRWCLSGTPIQNAVDDLYSYFRFLKYYPIDAYKHFCFAIKVPINRNPTNGYKMLQAVLKTIMLRRTKGTLIDGKPIINLPPKTVTLKKVDFSEEERAFYSTLEAESQQLFKEYAAAGTVKQNYVNILLMLLRLRQACDHPLLVKGSDFTSSVSSSMEMAKTLPQDKQIGLLSCLEACLMICTICNDSPEDAVVTICGHVFCNQCICERLTGDEKMCPLSNCKTQLSIASVFSKSTLSSCLSGRPYQDCSSGGVVTHALNSPKIHEDGISSDSSKIRAALEILLSLPGSQYSSRIKSSDKLNITSTISLDNEILTVPESFSVLPSETKYTHLAKPSTTRVSEKAIVFSQWTRMLDLLEIPLRGSFIKYRRLDGTMSIAAREKAVKDFNTLPEVTVMIMSLKAASLGLNMVAACHVLLLDLWWNPTTEDQAIDRAHRIGQTRPVTVSRLTVKETVEDRILALQEKKREMVASAFGEDESGSRGSRLTVEDLKYLFMVN